jgi:hypothetical protein
MIPTNKIKDKKYTSGGNALTSGGFGCLFKPALKCKNTNLNSNSNSNLVTKLMTKKHALDEFKQIQTFKSILQHIPNYHKYFLVDGFSKCEPAELTNDDLKDFDENCKALKKKDFTAANINYNLNEILALNMPNGGIDVDDYIDSFKDKSTLASLYMNLNTSLINLLVNGIDPMNKAQLYHCDVKGSNILISLENEKKTRLIDWGLSVYRKDDSKTHIPDKLNRRPFQFNVPFSIILFNKKFIEKYNLFLKKNETSDFFAIREFVINYIFYWNKIRGAGHLKKINSIFKRLTHDRLPAIENTKIKDHIVEYDFTYYYIVEYISKILFKYTIQGRLNLLDYFNNVFLNNIDVWGLTIIYMEFLDNLYEIYKDKDNDKLSSHHLQFIEKIKYIIIHFLFENPTEVINITKLAYELRSLNDIITHFENPKSNKNNKSNNSLSEYITSLTKISNNDIKEIGGDSKKKKKKKSRRYRIYRTNKKTTKKIRR